MQGKFEISMMGELTFFLGLQVKQSKDGTFISQTKYTRDLTWMQKLIASRTDITFAVGVCARFQFAPKESHMTSLKSIIRYVGATTDLGIWYTKDINTNLVGFSDSDWAGDVVDQKSTTGGCFYLENNLVSWYSKKQNCVSLLTVESEYVAVGSCCTQLLWVNQMIEDYGLQSGTLIVYCDNMSYISTDKQLADIFTKPLCESRFEELKNELGLIELS
ncbi:hypothetical protein DH2020_041675 [Rehmannia glutinosa]|uniref:Mitochondrial protein n=1 Tax=Rehmannia glutinosa TaxID=99300 RepID=A0ABR0UPH0_REHGL